jgi:hypothetical protein
MVPSVMGSAKSLVVLGVECAALADFADFADFADSK